MNVYFAGPAEHYDDALRTSGYDCTNRCTYSADADALILVWDGKDPEVEALLSKDTGGRPRHVYRVSYEYSVRVQAPGVYQAGEE